MSDGPQEAGEPSSPRSRHEPGAQKDFAARVAGKLRPKAADGAGSSGDGGVRNRHEGKGSSTPVAGSEASRVNEGTSGREVRSENRPRVRITSDRSRSSRSNTFDGGSDADFNG